MMKYIQNTIRDIKIFSEKQRLREFIPKASGPNLQEMFKEVLQREGK